MPIVERDQANFASFNESSSDFAWALKHSMSWTKQRDNQANEDASENDRDVDIVDAANQFGKSKNPTKSLRASTLAAIRRMKTELATNDLGFIHDDIVELPEKKVKFLVTFAFVPQSALETIAPEYTPRGILRWLTNDRMNPLYAQTTPSDIWRMPHRFYSARRSKASGGLYIGLFYVESKRDMINLFVPRSRKNFLPVTKIRQNSDLSELEWNWVQSLAYRGNKNRSARRSSAMSEGSSKSSGSRWKDFKPQRSRTCSEGTRNNLEEFKGSFHKAFDRLQDSTQVKLQHRDIFGEDTVVMTTNDTDSTTVAVMSGQTDMTQESNYSSWNDLDLELELDPSIIFDPLFNSEEQESQDGLGDLSSQSGQSGQHDQDTHARPTIRIIWVVKPMKCDATTTESSSFNKRDYCFYPFHIFDILHHSAYNSAIYAPLRKLMMTLQDTSLSIRDDMIESGALGLDQLTSDDPLDYFRHQKSLIIKHYQEQLQREQLQHGLLTPPRTPEPDSPTLPSFADQLPAESKALEESLTVISDEMRIVTSEWASISYTYLLVQFDRKRTLLKMGLRNDSEVILKPNSDPDEYVGNRRSSWGLEAILEMVRETQRRAFEKIKAVRNQQEIERLKLELERKALAMASKDIAKFKASEERMQFIRFAAIGGGFGRR